MRKAINNIFYLEEPDYADTIKIFMQKNKSMLLKYLDN